MRIFVERNTNTMQKEVYKSLQVEGIKRPSRNGTVLKFPTPVYFKYTHPLERVNFCPIRDANPFFHLMESVAMLNAYNSAPFLSRFAKNMMNFSDDGKTFNAFYGSRIRTAWGDQLAMVIDLLMKDPTTRQAVIGIWDPEDLVKKTKDKACNTMLNFQVRDHKWLDMTIINRSNDLVWGGVSGANVVHFSYFYEYVLCGTGYLPGSINVFCMDAHVYLNDQWDAVKGAESLDIYAKGLLKNEPLYSGPSIGFDNECSQFIQETLRDRPVLARAFHYPFFKDLCVPAYNAWRLYKEGKPEQAKELTDDIRYEDWQVACLSWISRRMKK